MADLLSSGLVGDGTELPRWLTFTDRQTPVIISYFFRTPEDAVGEAGMNAKQQAVVRHAIQKMQQAAGVIFVEVDNPENAMIHFNTRRSVEPPNGGFAAAYPAETGGTEYVTVFVQDRLLADGSTPNVWGLNGYKERVVMHEILHALGFSHADPNLVTGEESLLSIDGGTGPAELKALDIEALQYYYGAKQASSDQWQYNWDSATKTFNLVGSALDDVIIGIKSINNIDGGLGNDEIWGREFNDILNGGDGNDTVKGQYGNDVINGGNGDDVIDGGVGTDSLLGGAGQDRINGGDGADTLNGGDGDDILDGGVGADSLLGAAGNDSINGGDGADILNGGDGQDTLFGENDADNLQGGLGNDLVDGGAGNDSLYGSGGNDTLLGGFGLDYLSGGLGQDVFRFSNVNDFKDATGNKVVDVIADFKTLERDIIDLKLIDAKYTGASDVTDNSFTFIGRSSFSGRSGELRYSNSSGKTIISADTNGDRSADFQLELTGTLTLSSSHFVL